MMDSGDIQVKVLNKRASGQAFEVILTPTSPEGKDFPLSPQKKKETSLDEIQKKLDAAEERRKSQQAELLKHLAEKREHEKAVIQKAQENECKFRMMVRDENNAKSQARKEFISAQMAALNEKLKEKDEKLEKVRKNKEAIKNKN